VEKKMFLSRVVVGGRHSPSSFSRRALVPVQLPAAPSISAILISPFNSLLYHVFL
jgi:hypothetical protein